MSSVSQIETVGIHPIVILTISDFYNRMKVTSKGKVSRVYGALMGQKTGTKVEIFSAFEFENKSTDQNKVSIDMEYVSTRRDLATQLFPKLDIIGFFSTNKESKPNENDKEILKLLTYFGVISPIYLVLATNIDKEEELPITAYECDKVTKNFNKVNHIIEGWESERICLETVTKSTDVNNNENGLVKNLLTTKNALSALNANLKLIFNNLDKFKDDKVFLEMLQELIVNHPSPENSDYMELINQKKKEIFVLNNICSNVVYNSYLGRSENVYKENSPYQG